MAGIVSAASSSAHPLTHPAELDALAGRLSYARVVLLGASMHGTSDFLALRAMLTQRLIVSHSFNAVALEADWPAFQKVDRFVRGEAGGDPYKILHQFYRWPTWLWANAEFVELMKWLRLYNLEQLPEKRVSMHGLDLYALFESIDAVIDTLERIDPFLAREARSRYASLLPYTRDEIAYARSVIQFPEKVKTELLILLEDMLKGRLEDSLAAGEPPWVMQQSARVAFHAEQYYAAVARGDSSAWNIRERHMLDSVEALLNQVDEGTRVVLWAHNSHVGDARASAMQDQGYVSLGGLLREKLGTENVALVGFGTHHGQIIAAPGWDAPYQEMALSPPRAESWESVFHAICPEKKIGRFFFDFRDGASKGLTWANEKRDMRTVGVVYDPWHEDQANYLPTRIAEAFDAYVFVNISRALAPLHVPFRHSRIPETWPSGR